MKQNDIRCCLGKKNGKASTCNCSIVCHLKILLLWQDVACNLKPLAVLPSWSTIIICVFFRLSTAVGLKVGTSSIFGMLSSPHSSAHLLSTPCSLTWSLFGLQLLLCYERSALTHVCKRILPGLTVPTSPSHVIMSFSAKDFP